MSRWAPSIVSVASSDGGGIEVKWEVDSFFADSEPPEKVLIDLNGAPFTQLDGDEDSVEIPAATLTGLGAPSVTIGISFWWSGTPPEEKQSVVTVPLQGPITGGSGVAPAARPIVTVVRVQQRTVQTPASITIGWRSNNYNDGNIHWGPAAIDPAPFHHSIRPVGTVYHGTFTTDRPLDGNARYAFRVEVRNTLHSPTWIGTTIVVRSAPATLSVRKFLLDSGRPASTSLASLVGQPKSLHTLLFG